MPLDLIAELESLYADAKAKKNLTLQINLISRLVELKKTQIKADSVVAEAAVATQNVKAGSAYSIGDKPGKNT